MPRGTASRSASSSCHVSREEQKRRLLKRLDMPAKTWKFSAADAETRNDWKPYMRAVRGDDPRDEYVVRALVRGPRRSQMVHAARRRRGRVDALEEMSLAFPTVSRETRKQLAAARAALNGHGRNTHSTEAASR
jgi:polyphosphate kinase 2 (PPK2 family)